MLPLLAASALAVDTSELRVTASAGIEGVVNDPFLNRTGLRLGMGVAATPQVELAVGLGWYPILGNGGENDPDWKPLAKQLLLENSVSPDISKLVGQAQLAARVRFLDLPLDEHWRAAMGLAGGFGVFVTKDDLVALQNDGEDAVATQNQTHPGAVGGFFWEVREETVGARLRLEYDGYIETVNSTVTERKNNLFLGLEAVCWL